MRRGLWVWGAQMVGLALVTGKRPEVVCLCGSTKFEREFLEVQKKETLAGNIVLSVGWFGHKAKVPPTEEEKKRLDRLHLHKIDMAQTVFVVNPDGYIGESTAREVAYAVFTKKALRWYERRKGEQWMIRERHRLGAFVAEFLEAEMEAEKARREALALIDSRDVEDIDVIRDTGWACGVCHEPIDMYKGVVLGKPNFRVPAFNCCAACIDEARALINEANQ